MENCTQMFPVCFYDMVMVCQLHKPVLAADISIRMDRLSKYRQIIPVLQKLFADRFIGYYTTF